ncbi:uncharacterized protein plaat1l isoform 2-T2 [Lycodopsis pacificus]
MGLKHSHPQLFPGDIVEYRRNKYFSHFAVFYGEKDGVPYVAHLTCRDVVFVRFRRQAAALRPSSEVRGEAGSTGAAGEEIQGQQHAGRLVPGQRLPRRGEARHRRADGPRGDVRHPVSQQRAPGHAAPVRSQEVPADREDLRAHHAGLEEAV